MERLSPGIYRTKAGDNAIVRRIGDTEVTGCVKIGNVLFITLWDPFGYTIRVTCFANHNEINKRDYDLVERIKD